VIRPGETPVLGLLCRVNKRMRFCSKAAGLGFWIPDFGFRIPSFGFQTPDFGFQIPVIRFPDLGLRFPNFIPALAFRLPLRPFPLLTSKPHPPFVRRRLRTYGYKLQDARYKIPIFAFNRSGNCVRLPLRQPQSACELECRFFSVPLATPASKLAKGRFVKR